MLEVEAIRLSASLRIRDEMKVWQLTERNWDDGMSPFIVEASPIVESVACGIDSGSVVAADFS